MDGLIKRSPVDDPVYAFMDKKRSEGKPYYVYMTAGANKFLRIYYERVREYLASGRLQRKLSLIPYFASDQRTAVVLLWYLFFNLYKIFKVH